MGHSDPWGTEPGPAPTGDPYAPPCQQTGPLRRRPRRWLRWLILAIPVVIVLALVGLIALGWSLINAEVTSLMQQHPVVIEHLGEVRDCSVDVGATGREVREDYFHFNCVGSKDKARAILHTEPTGPDGEEQLVDGTLVLSSGQRIALRP